MLIILAHVVVPAPGGQEGGRKGPGAERHRADAVVRGLRDLNVLHRIVIGHGRRGRTGKQ